MASALRQVCVAIAHLDSSFHSYQTAKEVKRMMGVSEDEILEGTKLEDFNRREEEHSRNKPFKPTQIVVLKISPRNLESIRLAQSAGFVYKA
jgi:hypothetical protein